MSSEAQWGIGRGVVGESGEFTYKLVEKSQNNSTGSPSFIRVSPLVQRKLENLTKDTIDSFDLTGPGNLIQEDRWETIAKIALEKLCKLMHPFVQSLPFLLIDLVQDSLMFMEEYVKQKLNLKMDALGDFFGVLSDTEQQKIFKALLRTFSNKIRILDKQETDKLRYLYKNIMSKSIMAYKTSTEGFCQKDYLITIQKLGHEEEEGILHCLDTQEFEEILQFLHEITLFLQLAYHPQGFSLKPKETRLYKVRTFNDLTMISVSDCWIVGQNRIKLQEACLELIPEIKLIGKESLLSSFVLPIGDLKPYKMILENSSTLRSILSCLYQGNSTNKPEESMKENGWQEELDSETQYKRVKAEKLITFEGSSSNVRARIEGRQKKSVTFSDRDSVFEFEPNQYDQIDSQKKNSEEKKDENYNKIGIENKENRVTSHPIDRQHRKMLNLKELQLNPKHFIGKRQNKPPKLRLIHDSEESIESLKPGDNKCPSKKPLIKADNNNKDISNASSIFKSLNISKEEIQNKVMSKTSYHSRREPTEPLFSKRYLGDKPASKEGPNIIKIEIPSSSRSLERKQQSNLNSDRQKQLADITLAASNRELIATRQTPKHPTFPYRSSSAQNLNKLKHTRSNIDFMNQLTKRNQASANMSEISDSSARGFGRSLSAGRKMLSTLLCPGNKDQSSTSITDSLKNHHLAQRDDKIGHKANILASKLNFLNQYDKQMASSTLFGMKSRDKGLQLDLSIYQKILCGRSKVMPQSTKHAYNRIR